MKKRRQSCCQLIDKLLISFYKALSFISVPWMDEYHWLVSDALPAAAHSAPSTHPRHRSAAESHVETNRLLCGIQRAQTDSQMTDFPAIVVTVK